MKTPRQSHWRQENPRDQARVIISAAMGNLLNVKDGINPKEAIEKAFALLSDSQTILSSMPEGEWGSSALHGDELR